MAQRIKKHPAYTKAYGRALGIIGPEDSTDLSTSKPTLKATDKGGGVIEIKFNKSTSQGISFYCRHDGDTAPVFTTLQMSWVRMASRRRQISRP